MKRFSSQYTITNTTAPLKRALITTEDDGTIISVEDTGGDLEEKHSVEFYNGIIVPGFVNCHCHIELSHLKNKIPQGEGLGGFLKRVMKLRGTDSAEIASSIYQADKDMFKEGVSLCADICNSSDSFSVKKESKIRYINLLEVFGIDPDKAARRMEEILKVSESARTFRLPFYLVPHSVYSMSLSLLRLVKENSRHNSVTSIHFMETGAEKLFIESRSGPLLDSYKESGIIPSRLESAENHADTILGEVTPSGNLVLVHNTFADRELIRKVSKRHDLYWCLCPNSNIYIEKTLPPVNLLLEEGCKMVIGTDSLASNTKLNILSELITLQQNFPSLSVQELIRWATINGAEALGEENCFGKIEPGMKPGLLLLQNVDLENMKLLTDSFVTRLM
jgi:aminodeoxyfutalosine deaminase